MFKKPTHHFDIFPLILLVSVMTGSGSDTNSDTSSCFMRVTRNHCKVGPWLE